MLRRDGAGSGSGIDVSLAACAALASVCERVVDKGGLRTDAGLVRAAGAGCFAEPGRASWDTWRELDPGTPLPPLLFSGLDTASINCS